MKEPNGWWLLKSEYFRDLIFSYSSGFLIVCSESDCVRVLTLSNVIVVAWVAVDLILLIPSSTNVPQSLAISPEELKLRIYVAMAVMPASMTINLINDFILR